MSDEESSKGKKTTTAVKAAWALGGISTSSAPVWLSAAVVVIGVLYVLGTVLAPLILIMKFFHELFGGGGGGGGGGGEPPPPPDPKAYVQVVNGDGRDPLDSASVPPALLDHIEKAGALCTDIGPVVIAAQLRMESNFDEKKAGADGRKGIAQLTPEAFKQHGKDDDDNGETSPLDAADSIMAQGRHLCALYEEVKDLGPTGKESINNPLSRTLAAYHVGVEEVRKVKGVPNVGDTQSYVMNVRFYFPQFAGLIASVPPGSLSAVPTAPTTTTPAGR